MDEYRCDLDERREELGWYKVSELLDEAIDGYHDRCEAMLKRMVKLPAGAASSILIIDLMADEFEGGIPLWEDYYFQLLKSVSAYIASMGVRS